MANAGGSPKVSLGKGTRRGIERILRHKNGIVSRSDVLKAETEKAEADLGLVRARSLVRIGGGRLADALCETEKQASRVGSFSPL